MQPSACCWRIPEWPLRFADDYLFGLAHALLAWAFAASARAARGVSDLDWAQAKTVRMYFGMQWLLPQADVHWQRVLARRLALPALCFGDRSRPTVSAAAESRCALLLPGRLAFAQVLGRVRVGDVAREPGSVEYAARDTVQVLLHAQQREWRHAGERRR